MWLVAAARDSEEERASLCHCIQFYCTVLTWRHKGLPPHQAIDQWSVGGNSKACTQWMCIFLLVQHPFPFFWFSFSLTAHNLYDLGKANILFPPSQIRGWAHLSGRSNLWIPSHCLWSGMGTSCMWGRRLSTERTERSGRKPDAASSHWATAREDLTWIKVTVQRNRAHSGRGKTES